MCGSGLALTGVSRGGVGCCALTRGSITCSVSKAGSCSCGDGVLSGTSKYQQVWVKGENREWSTYDLHFLNLVK